MNAIIIEDEVLNARELQRKLQEVAPGLKVVATLPSVRTSVKWLMENPEPDIVFADIQLGDGSSFEVFEKYNLSCPVIFTTAFDEYAIKAFKVNGVDYLLKPIDETELERAVQKARVIIESKASYPADLRTLISTLTQTSPLENVYKEKFIVKHRNQWIPVSTRDIACFCRDELNYLYTFDGTKYILDFTALDEIESLLDPNIYYRMNRQYLVHIEAIQSVQVKENQKLVVTLKAPLKMQVDVSRDKAPAFKKWLSR